jgi:hypothetical protein
MILSLIANQNIRRLSDDHATVEHLIPIRKGGTNSRENTVATCLWCNNAKSGIENNLLMHIHPSLFKTFVRQLPHRVDRETATKMMVWYVLTHPEVSDLIVPDYNHNEVTTNIFYRNLHKEFRNPSLPPIFLQVIGFAPINPDKLAKTLARDYKDVI